MIICFNDKTQRKKTGIIHWVNRGYEGVKEFFFFPNVLFGKVGILLNFKLCLKILLISMVKASYAAIISHY